MSAPPATSPATQNRATELAMAAIQARMTTQQRQEAEKQAKIAETVGSIKALLLNFWDTLGIDPDVYTVDDRGRPTWKGSVTLNDPGDENFNYFAAVTLDTSVGLYEDGLHFRAGEAYAYAYGRSRHVNGVLPDAPPDEAAIGDLLLSGWIEAYRKITTEREERLSGLLNSANQIANGHASYPESAIGELTRRMTALKPGDLPDPYEKNLAKVRKAWDTAMRRVEADTAAHYAYAEAATNVKAAAARWLRRYAAWEDECSHLARNLTEHHFKPFVVYEIRYTAIGAPSAVTDEDGDTTIATEAIYTLQNPLEIAKEGQAIMVEAIDYSGNPYVVVIGAFLDARTAFDAKTPPATSGSARFFRSQKVGQSDYYMRFPPTVPKDTIQQLMDMISIPLPPAPFAEAVLEQMHIKIDDYNYTQPETWANVDPNTLRDEILDLGPKSNTNNGQPQEDLPIPF